MTEVDRDGGMDLADLLALIKQYKRWILAAPAIAGLAALMAVSLMRPLWEASVLLQVGQVGQILLEPVANVVSRMSHPSFVPGALNGTGLKTGEMHLAESYYRCSLKVTQVKGSDLIEVKLRSYSADIARNLAQGTVAYLQTVHGEIFSSASARIQEQIKNTDSSIQAASGQLDLLQQQLPRKVNSPDATLSAFIWHNKSTELHELTQRKLLLEEQISPLRTYATRTVGEVYVSGGPVSPNKPLIVLLATAGGLFAGFLAALVHSIIAKSKSRQLPGAP